MALQAPFSFHAGASRSFMLRLRDLTATRLLAFPSLQNACLMYSVTYRPPPPFIPFCSPQLFSHQAACSLFLLSIIFTQT